MEMHGQILKMKTELNHPVQYIYLGTNIWE